MINYFFIFLEIKQKLLLLQFHHSFLLNDQPFCACYVSLVQNSSLFSLVNEQKKKSKLFKLLCMLSPVINWRCLHFHFVTRYRSDKNGNMSCVLHIWKLQPRQDLLSNVGTQISWTESFNKQRKRHDWAFAVSDSCLWRKREWIWLVLWFYF